ncbi:oxidoreductase [Streptomyces sp. AJS327]|uniref:PDR/VanB family oxidoreductase n=1 Tax=Streptomyces sp. AJS327 TaxID=2545265 RepID=UPI0015DF8104|nr:PDR/VanB family oxidoreductase [Streptomyces sp. AJS327]MBA0050935.1 oxidoreductase [Streptomyces sp. AJS327]
MSVLSDRPLTLRLERRTRAADSAVLLEFASADGADLPPWDPGAHLELRLPSGLSRQYSLCGDPADRRTYTVCVLREEAGRGGSAEAHDRLNAGDEIGSSAPRNHFPLVEAPDYLLLAGGIGITPLRAMARELDRRGASWRLVYGGRALRSMAFAEELATAHPDRVTLVPQDERGLPDLAGLIAGLTPETRLYCCGPSPMLAAVSGACATAGVSDRLHLERFAADGDAPAGDTGAAFEVELRATGVTLNVAAGQSLLEAVRTVLPTVDSSCREGYCGTCETRVLEGQPEHRGSLMTPEEHDAEGTMLICVGRARGPRLVLDL